MWKHGKTALAGAAMIAATGHAGAALAQDCDRDCLLDVADDYLRALVVSDPAEAPLASDIMIVENLTPITMREGLWESTVTVPHDFQLFVPDEVNQTVGFLGVITAMAAPPAPQGMSAEERAEFAATAEKDEQPTLIALRLKLEDGEIVEAEHLVTGVRSMDPFQEPRPGLVSEVPEGARKSHDELIEIGASYYDALDDNDGALMPFAPDCERHENGMVTASGEPRPDAPAVPGQAATPQVARDCEGQLTSNAMAYITTIGNRRVFAADPVTGLVMGLSQFHHPMDFEPYTVTHMDGTTSTRSAGDMGFAPFDLPAAHIFKIGVDGMVHEIEAMGFMAPLNAPSGWEETDETNEAMAPAALESCDRDCLMGLADDYVAAMVAHDPSTLPLADDVRFVENAQDMEIGEGLWASAMSEPGDYVIHVLDEEAGTVGYMTVITYEAAPPAPQGTPASERAAWAASQPKSEQPVMLAVRLKLEAGEIAEAEHIFAGLRDVPETLEVPRPGLMAEIPEGERLPAGVLKTIGGTYYTALDDNDGTRAPFADDCSRHENGMTTSGGSYEAQDADGPRNARDCGGQLSSGAFQYIETIEDRRVFAADPVTGLAIGFSHFHHPMDNLPYPVMNTDGSYRIQDFDLAPFDAMSAHIFKIGPEGEMHEIEAIGATVPFRSPHWPDNE